MNRRLIVPNGTGERIRRQVSGARFRGTQGDLAAAAEIEQMAVSLIENRRSNPTVEVLEKVAAALNVPFVELFSGP
jgi:transcriptional regulator with XRE-family HTH domain